MPEAKPSALQIVANRVVAEWQRFTEIGNPDFPLSLHDAMQGMREVLEDMAPPAAADPEKTPEVSPTRMKMLEGMANAYTGMGGPHVKPTTIPLPQPPAELNKALADNSIPNEDFRDWIKRVKMGAETAEVDLKNAVRIYCAKLKHWSAKDEELPEMMRQSVFAAKELRRLTTGTCAMPEKQSA